MKVGSGEKYRRALATTAEGNDSATPFVKSDRPRAHRASTPLFFDKKAA